MSSHISNYHRSTQTIVTRRPRAAERRTPDRRQSIALQQHDAQGAVRQRRGSRRASMDEPTSPTTPRAAENMRRHNDVRRLQADVEHHLGWAGVHGIRAFSGLGVIAGTVCSLVVMFASISFHLVPVGAIALVGVWLLITCIGALVQYLARRHRMGLVQEQKDTLLRLREELLNAPAPAPEDVDEQHEEEAQLRQIERLINDIDGGFWYGLKCAATGFLEPTGWAPPLRSPRTLERRRAERRAETDTSEGITAPETAEKSVTRPSAYKRVRDAIPFSGGGAKPDCPPRSLRPPTR